MIVIPNWLVKVKFSNGEQPHQIASVQTLLVRETDLDHLTRILNSNRLEYTVEKGPDSFAFSRGVPG